MNFDYTWRCDCNEEGLGNFRECKKDAKAHLLSKHPDNCNVQVFIDQYDLGAGELSGTYWIMERVFNSLSRVKIKKVK